MLKPQPRPLYSKLRVPVSKACSRPEGHTPALHFSLFLLSSGAL